MRQQAARRQAGWLLDRCRCRLYRSDKIKRREERVVTFFVVVPLLDLEDREPGA
jgi:hypothetical protein